MYLKALLIAVALAGASLLIPSEAEAAPANPGGLMFGGFHHHHASGYWTTQYRNVWVPARFLGYDAWGIARYAPGYWRTVARRVWVPVRRRGHFQITWRW